MATEFPINKVITFTREEIEAEVKALAKTISDTFGADSERTIGLKAMYKDLLPRLYSAPASSKAYFHFSCAGGYVAHVNRVIGAVLKVKELYASLGGTVDATNEELVFAAMHHDLGKLGDEEGAVYLTQTEDYWKKRGDMFSFNEEIQFVADTDRIFYLLQKYGVKYTKKEMLGMRMADGMFKDANKDYFAPGFGKGPYPMKTSIGFLVHWADWMCAVSEKDMQRQAAFGY